MRRARLRPGSSASATTTTLVLTSNSENEGDQLPSAPPRLVVAVAPARSTACTSFSPSTT
jgi:hypothetical protein